MTAGRLTASITGNAGGRHRSSLAPLELLPGLALLAAVRKIGKFVNRMIITNPFLQGIEIDPATRTRRDPTRRHVDVAPETRVSPRRIVYDHRQNDRDYQPEIGDEEHEAGLESHDRTGTF